MQKMRKDLHKFKKELHEVFTSHKTLGDRYNNLRRKTAVCNSQRGDKEDEVKDQKKAVLGDLKAARKAQTTLVTHETVELSQILDAIESLETR
jgi:hypothetical protein